MKFTNVQGSFLRMKVRYLNCGLKQRIVPQRIKKGIFPIRIDLTVNYLSSKQENFAVQAYLLPHYFEPSV